MRGNFGLNYKIARNYLTNMLDYIVMQMRKLTVKRAIWKKRKYAKYTNKY